MNAEYFARVAVAAFLFGAAVVLSYSTGDPNWIKSKMPLWMQNEQTLNFVSAAFALGAVGSIIDRITSVLMLPLNPHRYSFIRANFANGAAFNFEFYSAKDNDTFRQWRHRRRAQLFFNVNCLVAVLAGIAFS